MGGVDQTYQPGRFAFGRYAASGRQLVVAATVIVAGLSVWRIGLLDQLLIDEPRERVVERAGGKAKFAAGAIADVADDGVAMARAIGKREENLEGLR